MSTGIITGNCGSPGLKASIIPSHIFDRITAFNALYHQQKQFQSFHGVNVK